MSVSESDHILPENNISQALPCWRFIRYFIHEIRTPLNAVHGFSELLKEEEDLNEIRLNVDRIQRNVLALEELISLAAEMVYVEDGVYQAHSRSFYPEELFRQVKFKGQALADKKGIPFTLNTDNLPPRLFGDDYRLRQVLTQLIANAIRITDSGMVAVAVNPIQEETWRIIISDSGPGISEDDLNRLRSPMESGGEDPFPRISNGLALIIARRFLNLMGLRFMIDSQIGSGTRVWFDLPEKG